MVSTQQRPGRAALDDVAAELCREPGVELATMFRSPGLRVHERIFAFLGHGPRLIVKLPRARALELVAAGDAAVVTMGSRTMREWVEVPLGDGPDAAAVWRRLAREALEYVRGL